MRHDHAMKTLALLSFALVGSLATFSSAHAQNGGVGESGMQQGTAQISTRADVTMSLSTMDGTTAARLQAISPQLSEKMSAIRQCYATVSRSRPTVTGTLAVSLVAPPTGTRTNVTASEDHVNDAELVRCTVRALESIRVIAANRPIGLVVHLTFSNSAARGVEETEAHRALQTSVELVGSGPDATVRGHIPTGEISFVARGPSDNAELRALGTVVLDHIAGLLDCRRRAGRRGASPEGDITLTFTVQGTRLVRPHVDANTVADRNAGTCAARALSSLRTATALHVPTATVVLHFGPST